MSAVEGLLRAYERFVRLPWDGSLAGPQRVWFAIYDPAQERRLRWRVEEFASATRSAGHTWRLVDLTDAFGRWMAGHEYREAYFEQPEDMDLTLKQDFSAFVADHVRATLNLKRFVQYVAAGVRVRELDLAYSRRRQLRDCL